jgi:glycosyltransferase involved in cell wall biosynthesis
MPRVLHVTEDHSYRNYGISTAVDMLTRCLPDNIELAIACVGEETLPLRAGIDLLALPTRGIGKTWRFSQGGEAALAGAVAQADVIHLHGLWMWVQWSAARLAARWHKPFIVSPHGMLEPWIWQRQSAPHRLKKWMYWKLLANPAFHQASRLHALTPREAATLRTYFPKHTIEVLPHGFDLQPADQAISELAPTHAGPPYFLFVGRLHPVKGIHLLIQAFARLPESSPRLIIAGPTQPQEAAYAESLRKLADDLNLASRVEFIGPVQGPAKWQLYRQAWAFCMTSFSEALSVVNLEAAACATPVITSYESGVIDEWDSCGGLRVHPEVESIYQALNQAANWSPAERNNRGAALRLLVEKSYSQQKIGSDWAALYQKMAAEGVHA